MPIPVSDNLDRDHAVGAGRRSDAHAAAPRRELHRVRQQVQQDLLQGALVGPHPGPVGARRVLQGDAALIGADGDEAQHSSMTGARSISSGAMS